MQCEQDYKFLDKPETLEIVSFLLTKWKTKYEAEKQRLYIPAYYDSLNSIE